ncbi:MAG: FAD-dependent oxidoreductase [Planctomycetota bacterium]
MTPTAEQIDLLIVGGGIAGIAIAERAAREAKRRGRHARIVVIERETMLASGASARLQGWFHSGALYSRLESTESIRECQQSYRTMIREYGRDSDFEFKHNCNATTPTGPEDPAANWFGEPIDYVIESPTSAPSRHVTTMLGRIASIWYEHPFGASGGHTDARNGAIHASTPDREMRTCNIARDLTRAAERLGVRFYTGASFDPAPIASSQGEPVTVRIADRSIRFSPRRTIVTIGAEVLRIAPTTESAIAQRGGVILTARTAVFDRNFATLATDPANNFSHITHGCTKTGKPHVYSAMSDSTELPRSASHEQCEAVARHILRKAISRFGAAAFEQSRLAWHACTKVEPTDPRSGSAVFAPVHRDLDASGKVTAIVPAKFSLFPSTASHAVAWLENTAFFDRAPDRPPSGASDAPVPARIASPLSAALVGIVPPQPSPLPTGSLIIESRAS